MLSEILGLSALCQLWVMVEADTFSSFARRENAIPKKKEGPLHAEPEYSRCRKAGRKINDEAETALKVLVSEDKPVDMEDRLVSEIQAV